VFDEKMLEDVGGAEMHSPEKNPGQCCIIS
jgi:hypothetical protein